VAGVVIGAGMAAGPAVAGGGAIAAALLAVLPGALPPVPTPPENPPSEAKRVLGKILFFDEQLSSDNTVACATCHVPGNGGADPRRVRTAGFDGLLNTPDDVFGSPGVIRSDANGDYVRDPVHGLLAQVTGRNANPPINAAFATDLFWDGRARTQFLDPQTGEVAVAAGGGLESQAAAPVVNSVEMGHDGRDWASVAAKLAAARPMALATALPADVAGALVDRPTYPELFERAFGDGQVTARRIAFALATYERTLIADDTPWDRTQAGLPGGLTPQQQQGLNQFNASGCAVCHTPPLFTDNTFRNIGLRPPAEDRGRQNVTGLAADRGKFKVPSLRNAGVRPSFMHNGEFTTLQQVIGFYGGPARSLDNRDPAMNNVQLPPPPPPGQPLPLQVFLQTGLTDARVANQTFPFDRPLLYTDRPGDRPAVLAGGRAGSGGIVPAIIATAPPYIGNAQFKIGLDRALGGATAHLAVSSSPPVGGVIARESLLGPVTVPGTGAGAGPATLHWPIMPGSVTQGQVVYVQWVVSDPGAAGGEALSAPVQVRYFCGQVGCAPKCAADWDGSGSVTTADVSAFVNAWFAGVAAGTRQGDFNRDGRVEPTDVAAFVTEWLSAAGGAC
jgi:cytochrome c peroxidase